MKHKGLYYIVEYILQKDIIIIVADCLHLLFIWALSTTFTMVIDGKLNSLKVRQ